MSDDTQLPDGVDESEREAFEAWIANGNDADDADGFRDAYAGQWFEVADYIEEWYRDTGADIPSWLEYYVDWKALARDWELNGDIWTETTSSGIHIFRNL